MDEIQSKHAFDDAVAQLMRLADDCAGIGPVEVAGRAVLVAITNANSGRKYRLRIECGEEFPRKPPDYLFVSPATGKDDDASCWPDDGHDAFKSNESPRWICAKGTSAYASRHAEHQYDARRDTVNETVFHIMRRING